MDQGTNAKSVLEGEVIDIKLGIVGKYYNSNKISYIITTLFGFKVLLIEVN